MIQLLSDEQDEIKLKYNKKRNKVNSTELIQKLENFSNQLKNELYKKNYEYLTSFLLQYIIEFDLWRKCHPPVNSEIMKSDWITVVSIIIHSDR